jgi:hypothetical protein
MAENAILFAASLAESRPSPVCFSSISHLWRYNEELGVSLRKIEIVCTGHRRVMGFSQTKLVLPTSCFVTWSHVQNVIIVGNRCKFGLNSCIKNVRRNFCENRSCVFKKKLKWDTKQPRACRFQRLPFSYKEATYAENVSTSQKPRSLHY